MRVLAALVQSRRPSPGWRVDARGDEYPDSAIVDVIPCGDLIDHEPDDDCTCGPRLDPLKRDDGSMGWVVVHHSLDGREATEDQPWWRRLLLRLARR